MAYKCVHCSEIYKDGSDEILTGCNKCKGKFFFYIKEEKMNEIINNQKEELELSTAEKKRIEKDVRYCLGKRFLTPFSCASEYPVL